MCDGAKMAASGSENTGMVAGHSASDPTLQQAIKHAEGVLTQASIVIGYATDDLNLAVERIVKASTALDAAKAAWEAGKLTLDTLYDRRATTRGGTSSPS